MSSPRTHKRDSELGWGEWDGGKRRDELSGIGLEVELGEEMSVVCCFGFIRIKEEKFDMMEQETRSVAGGWKTRGEDTRCKARQRRIDMICSMEEQRRRGGSVAGRVSGFGWWECGRG